MQKALKYRLYRKERQKELPAKDGAGKQEKIAGEGYP